MLAPCMWFFEAFEAGCGQFGGFSATRLAQRSQQPVLGHLEGDTSKGTRTLRVTVVPLATAREDRSAMPDRILDYAPPKRPRPSALWWLVRSVIALIFGAWGLWLLYGAIGELFAPAGALRNFFGLGSLGLTFCAVAAAALVLPVHRKPRN
jgi:hypothetical protein